MGDFCRTCSREADPRTANNLFEPSSAAILVEIEELTNILLEDVDNLPKLICQNCQLDLKIATDFRRACIEAQELFKLQDKEDEVLDDHWVGGGSLEDVNYCPLENNEDMVDYLPECQDDISAISENPVDPEYLMPSLSLNEYASEDCPPVVADMCLTDPQLSNETFKVIDVPPEPEISQENEAIDTDYTCSNCGLGFDDAQGLRTHKYQLHDVSPNTKFVCHHCEEGFRSAAALSKHCQVLKLPCIEECVKCKAKFHNQILLETHSEVCQKSVEGKHVCHICGKSLSTSFILKTHLVRHSGARPHKCLQCGSTFAVANELGTHMKTHSSVRSYACRYNCGKFFRFSSARSSHERIHMDDSKRIHHCAHCPKSFVTPSSCRAHQKQHNLDRDHRCDTCLISFRHIKHYKNHLKSNTHKVLEARAAAAKRHPYIPH